MVEGVLVNMPACKQCGTTAVPVSAAIGSCVACIRKGVVPTTGSGVPCPVHLPLVGSLDETSWVPCLGFFDRHPANCIASWLCPGTTGCGYPRYAVAPGPEVGCQNLAIFFGGCNFTCPFCQDWIHRLMLSRRIPRFALGEILKWPNAHTTCICFCGGTPDLHMREVLWLAEHFSAAANGRVLRFCAETNLTADSSLLREFAGLVLKSGGGLNIGLKAGTDAVHRALTGMSNEPVLANLRMLHETFGVNHLVPFLRPSLLLVPGYVDETEIAEACRVVADMDANIPMKFIRFLPRNEMTDLPPTSDEEMRVAVRIARDFGLQRISPVESEIGKQHRFVTARDLQK